MADILIAAAPEDAAELRALVEALSSLGHSVKPAALDDAAIGSTINAAGCVLAVWSRSAPPPALVAAAALALDRKKLISAEFGRDSAPAPLQAAPRFALNPRDRAGFKRQFEALLAEVSKASPSAATPEALAETLIKVRAALLSAPAAARPLWQTLGGLALAVGVLFVIGFGAGRVISAVRSGQFLVATAPAEANATSAPAATVSTLTWDRLEREPWRTSAARIEGGADILARADSGDARAQALACLAHLAGVEGFLPSPTAARAFCDASAAQREPAGLYLSWVLHRAAPHAGLDEAVARERLAEASRLGWSAAQIDYGSVLAPDHRAPASAQAEAGRLWLAAAEAGDPRGQFFYARWLRDSPAGPRDPRQAMPFLERAAEANHSEALHMLATLTRDGIGTAANAERAKALYERAADRDHTPSMFNLADMLRAGSAEERARAVALYRRLACLPDERQIAPLAARRLRALGESVSCG